MKTQSHVRRPHLRRLASALAVGLMLSASLAGVADARRGGGFGSRGMRTYSAPQSTYLSPGGAAPIQRSMTAPGTTSGGFQPYGAQPSYAPGYAQPYASPRSFGGGFVGGLLTGGLVGAMLGHGFGGGWGGYGYGGGMGMGLISLIFQLGLVALIVWGVSRLFRRGRGLSPVSGPAPFAGAAFAAEPGPVPGQAYAGPWSAPAGPPVRDEIGIGPGDRAAFERLLGEMQDAFAREDYAALRAVCTPEVVSYLSEELSQNATHGRRNDVSALRLLSMELSEAWREADADYATVALRYESIDVMRDRQTGAVVEGDPNTPTQTTEIWSFARRLGGPEAGRWKLSAIQDA
jgi:predicted lipid-binding transport protein (Tim44 family)